MASYVRSDFDRVQASEPRLGEKENFNPGDSVLELADPTPDIHDLFVRFDAEFFWNTLGMVQVLWSHRMTKCAGMCYFEGKHGLCKITLSAPLLSLRPRKDLVETLLHEMIHAYLFVTNNYKDRDDHGPEFRRHMHRINMEAGTNITVYHTFHDEVEYYQRHIWRCNGVCRFKKPFFGFVKRSMNRAPGPNDSWWNQHRMECNGTFIKVSEPEKKERKKRERKIRQIGPKSLLKSKDLIALLGTCTASASSACSTDIKPNEEGSTSERLHGIEGGIKSCCSATVKTSGGPQQHGSGDVCPKENVHQTSSEKVTPGGGGNEPPLSARDVVRNAWAHKYLPSMQRAEEEKTGGVEMSKPESIIKQHGNRARLEEDSQENVHLTGKDSVTGESPIDLGSETEPDSDMLPCPCCYKWFLERNMNFHLDECLTMAALENETFQ